MESNLEEASLLGLVKSVVLSPGLLEESNSGTDPDARNYLTENASDV